MACGGACCGNVRLAPDGEFSINRDFIGYHTHGLNRPFTQRFIEAFGPQRRKDEPLGDRHRDLAFALHSQARRRDEEQSPATYDIASVK